MLDIKYIVANPQEVKKTPVFAQAGTGRPN